MFTRNICMEVRAPTEMIKPLLSLITLALISNSALAEAPVAPKSTLSHSLGGLEFTLSNEEKNCQIMVKNESSSEAKTTPLLLESPCYWIAKSEPNSLLHYSYESIDVDNTLLIAGTPLDWPEEKKTYQKLPTDSYCTQFLQGIILSKDQVFAVNEKMVAAHCETGLAIDEKIFYAMAHNPDRYQDKLPEAAVEMATKTAEAIKNTPGATDAKVKPEDLEEKSFIDSVTDTIKGLFSGEDKDAK